MTRPDAAAWIGVRIPSGLVIGPDTGQIRPDEDGGLELGGDGWEVMVEETLALAALSAFASATHSRSFAFVCSSACWLSARAPASERRRERSWSRSARTCSVR